MPWFLLTIARGTAGWYHQKGSWDVTLDASGLQSPRVLDNMCSEPGSLAGAWDSLILANFPRLSDITKSVDHTLRSKDFDECFSDFSPQHHSMGSLLAQRLLGATPEF